MLAYICSHYSFKFFVMTKLQKNLALELIVEKQSDNQADKLPTVLVQTVKTLIILIGVAKLFTNDKVDELLNRLATALELFIDETGV